MVVIDIEKMNMEYSSSARGNILIINAKLLWEHGDKSDAIKRKVQALINLKYNGYKNIPLQKRVDYEEDLKYGITATLTFKLHCGNQPTEEKDKFFIGLNRIVKVHERGML